MVPQHRFERCENGAAIISSAITRRCKFSGFRHAIPKDLTGKSVLDIGCNAGFYSIEMKKRGADRVLAIDSDEEYLQAGALCRSGQRDGHRVPQDERLRSSATSVSGSTL